MLRFALLALIISLVSALPAQAGCRARPARAVARVVAAPVRFVAQHRPHLVARAAERVRVTVRSGCR